MSKELELIAKAIRDAADDGEYAEGMAERVVSVLAASGHTIMPRQDHPYFVWERGYQASIYDQSRNNFLDIDDYEYTSNPHSLGDPTPTAAAAAEEEKA